MACDFLYGLLVLLERRPFFLCVEGAGREIVEALFLAADEVAAIEALVDVLDAVGFVASRYFFKWVLVLCHIRKVYRGIR